MKIYIMTDVEAVAGVMDFDDWCTPQSRYYEVARELLTLETNAAIEGFFAGGATQITVADGHGPGAINPVLLDDRVELSRGWPQGRPFLLDSSFDAIAWVGQHAKAGTVMSHLTHTNWFDTLDMTINGVSVGEFGELALGAGELGVPCIFLAGEQACCEEAAALVPGIKTVAVKRGVNPDPGDGLTIEQYKAHNTGVITIHPQKARQLIGLGAQCAAERFGHEPFGLARLEPPYELVLTLRAGDNDSKRRKSVVRHPDSVIDLLNTSRDWQPID